jgi:hypothetical protein
MDSCLKEGRARPRRFAGQQTAHCQHAPTWQRGYQEFLGIACENSPIKRSLKLSGARGPSRENGGMSVAACLRASGTCSFTLPLPHPHGFAMPVLLQVSPKNTILAAGRNF